MAAEKCPECGTWWRGFEHRCSPITTTTQAVVVLPRDPDYVERDER